MVSPNDDYYGWTQETIEKLRQGRLSEVSMEDLIEELEDMGGSERNELENRLVVLLTHLLKWRYQPERRSRSWQLTIKEQRQRIVRRLKKSPSLRPRLPELGKEDAYPIAITVTAREANMFTLFFMPGLPPVDATRSAVPSRVWLHLSGWSTLSG